MLTLLLVLLPLRASALVGDVQKPPAKPAAEPAAKPSARELEDAAARAAFVRLTPAAKKDVVDFLTLETGHLQSFQASLVTWVTKRADRDAGSWKARTPPPFFDPVVHAPAQPTPRTWLAEGSALSNAATKEILGGVPVRALAPGYVYDYATLEIVRVRVNDELQRVFDNALAGFPPDLDLAEALVERALDDGSEKDAAEAFAHAYTDRSGNVYPGITLYDAYASQSEFEMPDVDVLGIIHTLFPDANAPKAPIPGAQQEALYKKIGGAFIALHRHRSLRHALALAYLEGTATLRDGYQGNLDNFHALWEDCASNPETLRARLPNSAKRDEFLAAWVKHCMQKDSPFQMGLVRHATLDENALAVRACVLRVLTEYGALPPSEAHDTTSPERPH